MIFQSARIKLTIFYVAVIMTVSLFFSISTYQSFSRELYRGLHRQALRIIPFGDTVQIIPPEFEQAFFDEARQRIIFELIFVNLGIFTFSSASGYFLAGRTLHPIESMVDEQKRFIADASHELRTPLTSMKTEIEVALRDKNLTSKFAKELLTSNLEEVNKLQSFSDYLLTLSRYENDQAKFKFEKFEIELAIEKAVKKVKPMAATKNIEIVSEVENFKINGNEISFIELFGILIDNAIKYSNDKSKVIVSAHRQNHNAILEVQDFGIGIKATDIPFIFNRFYRVETSRNKKQIDGYGLGLSIAKRIVDLHHGKIDVSSILNEGTKFTIVLPLT